MPVGIYQVDKGFSLNVWLCDPHKAKREADGYSVKSLGPAPHDGLTCLDCHFGEPTTTTQGANDAHAD